MTRRAVLYGYRIQNGAYVADPETAAVVRSVFDLYAQGESYSRIAEDLNRDGVPYLPDRPLWNKHLIKRILQNPKYTGGDAYPPLIHPEQFQAVQDLIAGKTAGRTHRKPAAEDKLWPYLICGSCGGAMKRTGGGPPDRSNVYLRCKACGQPAKVSRAKLAQEVVMQYNAYVREPEEPYQPSKEAIRLDNAINRSLEHVEDPDMVICLILQGVSARYGSFTAAQTGPEIRNINEMDWRCFRALVSGVTVSPDDTISLLFREQKQKEAD